MAKSKPRKKKKNAPPAQTRNDAIKRFVLRLHELCELMNCDVMQYLTTPDVIRLIAIRRVRVGKIRDIHSEYDHYGLKSFYSQWIQRVCNTKMIALANLPEQVSYIDFTYMDALKAYLSSQDCSIPHLSEKYINQLNRFVKDNDVVPKLQFCLLHLMFMDNLPNQPISSFTIDVNQVYNLRSNHYGEFTFDLHVQKPIKEYIVIDHIRRPVYRLFLPAGAPEHNHFITLPPNYLAPLYKGNTDTVPVFIQSHAIKRLKERLSPINPLMINLCFSFSWLNMKTPFIKGHKVFIPFYTLVTKTGYWVAEIIDRKVVIKTFILVTHASAPEGSKFQELTGFTKTDMSYWDITKLETFIYNDMQPDNALYTYFEQSGLLQLFDLNKNLTVSSQKNRKSANWNDMYACMSKLHQRDVLSREELQNIDFSQLLT